MEMTDYRLDDLRLFVAVADARSFTAAARTLRTTKQLVSRRVGELEQRLGVQLLRRSTRQVATTDAGAAFADRCRDVFRRLADAEAELRATELAPRGCLRVTADQTFGRAFLAPLLAEYLDAHAGVDADVLLTTRRVDLLEEGFDIAIRIGRVDGESLATTELGPAHIVFCASPDYLDRSPPLRRPTDLARHACVANTAGGERVVWPFRSGPVTVHPRLRTSDYGLAKQASCRASASVCCRDSTPATLSATAACARSCAGPRCRSAPSTWCIPATAIPAPGCGPSSSSPPAGWPACSAERPIGRDPAADFPSPR